ncbi:putative Histone acetyltransferase KAT8 [Blattamonas nauphoetae]|uniref:Histone acetyltransferase n=1 Tax=Blattamonas nauphoetae TaxID=2049346 RepID=A0ABQ9XLU3_9EUKA|nr:putative Histone acetyltransferase KAT8 [Blattamonas nauphoetae]
MSVCQTRSPPGDEIYRDANISLYYVSGREIVYCQNLCLLMKLFIEHKTLFYDIESFAFFVLCEVDDEGAHIVAAFSKDLRTSSPFNLSCITTLPPYQRKGYGYFLTSACYALSRFDQIVKTPERPLSDLGIITFLPFWQREVLQVLSRHEDLKFSLKELAEEAFLTPPDVILALRSMNMIQIDNSVLTIHITHEQVLEELAKRNRTPKVAFDNEKLFFDPDYYTEYKDSRPDPSHPATSTQKKTSQSKKKSKGSFYDSDDTHHFIDQDDNMSDGGEENKPKKPKLSAAEVDEENRRQIEVRLLRQKERNEQRLQMREKSEKLRKEKEKMIEMLGIAMEGTVGKRSLLNDPLIRDLLHSDMVSLDEFAAHVVSNDHRLTRARTAWADAEERREAKKELKAAIGEDEKMGKFENDSTDEATQSNKTLRQTKRAEVSESKPQKQSRSVDRNALTEASRKEKQRMEKLLPPPPPLLTQHESRLWKVEQLQLIKQKMRDAEANGINLFEGMESEEEPDTEPIHTPQKKKDNNESSETQPPLKPWQLKLWEQKQARRDLIKEREEERKRRGVDDLDASDDSDVGSKKRKDKPKREYTKQEVHERLMIRKLELDEQKLRAKLVRSENHYKEYLLNQIRAFSADPEKFKNIPISPISPHLHQARSERTDETDEPTDEQAKMVQGPASEGDQPAQEDITKESKSSLGQEMSEQLAEADRRHVAHNKREAERLNIEKETEEELKRRLETIAGMRPATRSQRTLSPDTNSDAETRKMKGTIRREKMRVQMREKRTREKLLKLFTEQGLDVSNLQSTSHKPPMHELSKEQIRGYKSAETRRERKRLAEEKKKEAEAQRVVVEDDSDFLEILSERKIKAAAVSGVLMGYFPTMQTRRARSVPPPTSPLSSREKQPRETGSQEKQRLEDEEKEKEKQREQEELERKVEKRRRRTGAPPPPKKSASRSQPLPDEYTSSIGLLSERQLKAAIQKQLESGEVIDFVELIQTTPEKVRTPEEIEKQEARRLKAREELRERRLKEKALKEQKKLKFAEQAGDNSTDTREEVSVSELTDGQRRTAKAREARRRNKLLRQNMESSPSKPILVQPSISSPDSQTDTRPDQSQQALVVTRRTRVFDDSEETKRHILRGTMAIEDPSGIQSEILLRQQIRRYKRQADGSEGGETSKESEQTGVQMRIQKMMATKREKKRLEEEEKARKQALKELITGSESGDDLTDIQRRSRKVNEGKQQKRIQRAVKKTQEHRPTRSHSTPLQSPKPESEMTVEEREAWIKEKTRLAQKQRRIQNRDKAHKLALAELGIKPLQSEGDAQDDDIRRLKERILIAEALLKRKNNSDYEERAQRANITKLNAQLEELMDQKKKKKKESSEQKRAEQRQHVHSQTRSNDHQMEGQERGQTKSSDKISKQLHQLDENVKHKKDAIKQLEDRIRQAEKLAEDKSLTLGQRNGQRANATKFTARLEVLEGEIKKEEAKKRRLELRQSKATLLSQSDNDENTDPIAQMRKRIQQAELLAEDSSLSHGQRNGQRANITKFTAQLALLEKQKKKEDARQTQSTHKQSKRISDTQSEDDKQTDPITLLKERIKDATRLSEDMSLTAGQRHGHRAAITRYRSKLTLLEESQKKEEANQKRSEMKQPQQASTSQNENDDKNNLIAQLKERIQRAKQLANDESLSLGQRNAHRTNAIKFTAKLAVLEGGKPKGETEQRRLERKQSNQPDSDQHQPRRQLRGSTLEHGEVSLTEGIDEALEYRNRHRKSAERKARLLQHKAEDKLQQADQPNESEETAKIDSRTEKEKQTTKDLAAQRKAKREEVLRTTEKDAERRGRESSQQISHHHEDSQTDGDGRRMTRQSEKRKLAETTPTRRTRSTSKNQPVEKSETDGESGRSILSKSGRRQKDIHSTRETKQQATQRTDKQDSEIEKTDGGLTPHQIRARKGIETRRRNSLQKETANQEHEVETSVNDNFRTTRHSVMKRTQEMETKKHISEETPKRSTRAHSNLTESRENKSHVGTPSKPKQTLMKDDDASTEEQDKVMKGQDLNTRHKHNTATPENQRKGTHRKPESELDDGNDTAEGKLTPHQIRARKGIETRRRNAILKQETVQREQESSHSRYPKRGEESQPEETRRVTRQSEQRKLTKTTPQRRAHSASKDQPIKRPITLPKEKQADTAETTEGELTQLQIRARKGIETKRRNSLLQQETAKQEHNSSRSRYPKRGEESKLEASHPTETAVQDERKTRSQSKDQRQTVEKPIRPTPAKKSKSETDGESNRSHLERSARSHSTLTTMKHPKSKKEEATQRGHSAPPIHKRDGGVEEREGELTEYQKRAQKGLETKRRNLQLRLEEAAKGERTTRHRVAQQGVAQKQTEPSPSQQESQKRQQKGTPAKLEKGRHYEETKRKEHETLRHHNRSHISDNESTSPNRLSKTQKSELREKQAQDKAKRKQEVRLQAETREDTDNLKMLVDKQETEPDQPEPHTDDSGLTIFQLRAKKANETKREKRKLAEEEAAKPKQLERKLGLGHIESASPARVTRRSVANMDSVRLTRRSQSAKVKTREYIEQERKRLESVRKMEEKRILKREKARAKRELEKHASETGHSDVERTTVSDSDPATTPKRSQKQLPVKRGKHHHHEAIQAKTSPKETNRPTRDISISKTPQIERIVETTHKEEKTEKNATEAERPSTHSHVIPNHLTHQHPSDNATDNPKEEHHDEQAQNQDIHQGRDSMLVDSVSLTQVIVLSLLKLIKEIAEARFRNLSDVISPQLMSFVALAVLHLDHHIDIPIQHAYILFYLLQSKLLSPIQNHSQVPIKPLSHPVIAFAVFSINLSVLFGFLKITYNPNLPPITLSDTALFTLLHTLTSGVEHQAGTFLIVAFLALALFFGCLSLISFATLMNDLKQILHKQKDSPKEQIRRSNSLSTFTPYHSAAFDHFRTASESFTSLDPLETLDDKDGAEANTPEPIVEPDTQSAKCSEDSNKSSPELVTQMHLLRSVSLHPRIPSQSSSHNSQDVSTVYNNFMSSPLILFADSPPTPSVGTDNLSPYSHPTSAKTETLFETSGFSESTTLPNENEAFKTLYNPQSHQTEQVLPSFSPSLPIGSPTALPILQTQSSIESLRTETAFMTDSSSSDPQQPNRPVARHSQHHSVIDSLSDEDDLPSVSSSIEALNELKMMINSPHGQNHTLQASASEQIRMPFIPADLVRRPGASTMHRISPRYRGDIASNMPIEEIELSPTDVSSSSMDTVLVSSQFRLERLQSFLNSVQPKPYAHHRSFHKSPQASGVSLTRCHSSFLEAPRSPFHAADLSTAKINFLSMSPGPHSSCSTSSTIVSDVDPHLDLLSPKVTFRQLKERRREYHLQTKREKREKKRMMEQETFEEKQTFRTVTVPHTAIQTFPNNGASWTSSSSTIVLSQLELPASNVQPEATTDKNKIPVPIPVSPPHPATTRTPPRQKRFAPFYSVTVGDSSPISFTRASTRSLLASLLNSPMKQRQWLDHHQHSPQSDKRASEWRGPLHTPNQSPMNQHVSSLSNFPPSVPLVSPFKHKRTLSTRLDYPRIPASPLMFSARQDTSSIRYSLVEIDSTLEQEDTESSSDNNSSEEWDTQTKQLLTPIKQSPICLSQIITPHQKIAAHSPTQVPDLLTVGSIGTIRRSHSLPLFAYIRMMWVEDSSHDPVETAQKVSEEEKNQRRDVILKQNRDFLNTQYIREDNSPTDSPLSPISRPASFPSSTLHTSSHLVTPGTTSDGQSTSKTHKSPSDQVETSEGPPTERTRLMDEEQETHTEPENNTHIEFNCLADEENSQLTSEDPADFFEMADDRDLDGDPIVTRPRFESAWTASLGLSRSTPEIKGDMMMLQSVSSQSVQDLAQLTPAATPETPVTVPHISTPVPVPEAVDQVCPPLRLRERLSNQWKKIKDWFNFFESFSSIDLVLDNSDVALGSTAVLPTQHKIENKTTPSGSPSWFSRFVTRKTPSPKSSNPPTPFRLLDPNASSESAPDLPKSSSRETETQQNREKANKTSGSRSMVHLPSSETFNEGIRTAGRVWIGVCVVIALVGFIFVEASWFRWKRSVETWGKHYVLKTVNGTQFHNSTIPIKQTLNTRTMTLVELSETNAFPLPRFHFFIPLLLFSICNSFYLILLSLSVLGKVLNGTRKDATEESVFSAFQIFIGSQSTSSEVNFLHRTESYPNFDTLHNRKTNILGSIKNSPIRQKWRSFLVSAITTSSSLYSILFGQSFSFISIILAFFSFASLVGTWFLQSFPIPFEELSDLSIADATQLDTMAPFSQSLVASSSPPFLISLLIASCIFSLLILFISIFYHFPTFFKQFSLLALFDLLIAVGLSFLLKRSRSSPSYTRSSFSITAFDIDTDSSIGAQQMAIVDKVAAIVERCVRVQREGQYWGRCTMVGMLLLPIQERFLKLSRQKKRKRIQSQKVGTESLIASERQQAQPSQSTNESILKETQTVKPASGHTEPQQTSQETTQLTKDEKTAFKTAINGFMRFFQSTTPPQPPKNTEEQAASPDDTPLDDPSLPVPAVFAANEDLFPPLSSNVDEDHEPHHSSKETGKQPNESPLSAMNTFLGWIVRVMDKMNSNTPNNTTTGDPIVNIQHPESTEHSSRTDMKEDALSSIEPS